MRKVVFLLLFWACGIESKFMRQGKNITDLVPAKARWVGSRRNCIGVSTKAAYRNRNHPTETYLPSLIKCNPKESAPYDKRQKNLKGIAISETIAPSRNAEPRRNDL